MPRLPAAVARVGAEQSGSAASAAMGAGAAAAATIPLSHPSSFPTDGLSRHWHSLPPAGVPSRFHLATRFSLGSWDKALAWYNHTACKHASAAAVAAASGACEYARGWAGRLEAQGLPLLHEEEAGEEHGEEEEDDEKGAEREGGRRPKLPAVCLSEAEMLKLSLSLSSCTSGQEGAPLSGGRGGRGDVLSSGPEGVLSGRGEGEGEEERGR